MMLIVNADDYGLRAEVTDAIVACWRAGGISAASAMTHMADSRRAAAIARETSLPLGLHLNLTTPFTAKGAVAARESRQRQACAYFAGPQRRRFVFDPRARRLLDCCIADQLEAFAEEYGRAPLHGDGHQHIQVCPTVLATGSLGRLESLRAAHSFPPGRSSYAKRMHRAAINWIVRRRFRSIRFLSLRDLHPKLGGEGLERELTLVAEQKCDVELMVHPAWDDERRILLSAEWRQALQGIALGSYADLR
jgi:chitin disaccharide deacetylase